MCFPAGDLVRKLGRIQCLRKGQWMRERRVAEQVRGALG